MYIAKKITYQQWISRSTYRPVIVSVGEQYLGEFNSEKMAKTFIRNVYEPVGYCTHITNHDRLQGWYKTLHADKIGEWHLYKIIYKDGKT